jgi:hypothetical protein
MTLKNAIQLAAALTRRTPEQREAARTQKINAVYAGLANYTHKSLGGKVLNEWDPTTLGADLFELGLDLLLTQDASTKQAPSLELMISNLVTNLNSKFGWDKVLNAPAVNAAMKDILTTPTTAGAKAKVDALATAVKQAVSNPWPFSTTTAPADAARQAKTAMKDAIHNGLRTTGTAPATPAVSSVKGVAPRKVAGKPAVWANVRTGAGISPGKRRITRMEQGADGYTKVGVGKTGATGWRIKPRVSDAPFLTFIIGSENGTKVSFEEALAYWNLSLSAK